MADTSSETSVHETLNQISSALFYTFGLLLDTAIV